MRRPAAPPIVNFIAINGGLCGHLRSSVCAFVRRWEGGRVAGEGGVEPRQVCAYVRCDNEPIMLQIGIWRTVVVFLPL